MEWLGSVYLGCFIFGLVFTVASFLLGGFSHFEGGHVEVGHGGGHVGGGHVGGGHGAAGHGGGHVGGHGSEAQGNQQAGGLGWFSFNALIAFITWLGGSGFVMSKMDLSVALQIPISVGFGILGYMLVYLFLAKILYPAQTPVMQDFDYDLVGTVGYVSGTIFENGVGEIIYTKFGTRRNVPARSIDGRAFPRDSEVVILRYDKGVAYVDELDKLLNSDRAESQPAIKEAAMPPPTPDDSNRKTL